MVAIVEFYKPVVINGVASGGYHKFLLFQSDDGTYTDIACGGPQSASSTFGFSGSNANQIDDFGNGSRFTGLGTGNILANVEPYNALSTTPAKNDFFKPDVLNNFSSRQILAGDESTLRQEWNKLYSIADQINSSGTSYTVPFGNSNSVATTFADALGASRQDNGLFSGHFSPA
jgi:hypothetical protein